jgi:hypothetical protein
VQADSRGSEQVLCYHVTNLGRDVCAKSDQRRKRAGTEVGCAGQSELWGKELMFIAIDYMCIYVNKEELSRKA